MPLYSMVECPHCGNEILVNSERETTKCSWCRRIVSVKFIGNTKKGKKAKAEVKAIDFSEDPRRKERHDVKVKSYNDWRNEDIYGRK